MNLIEKVKAAGVVGAGGGGFPAHVKIDAKVEYVIANGAECEPLLHKDTELMLTRAGRVIEGILLVMAATGAQNGIIGIKEKYTLVIEALSNATSGTNIKIHPLGDFYPTGDEFVLVYEATGRLIPPAGIPLEIGVVVHNVESLYNIASAAKNEPVTKKFITVTGAVKQPSTFIVPIGTSYSEAIELAGGTTVNDYVVVADGAMMGRVEEDMSLPATKTAAGLIVLPSEHTLVKRKRMPAESVRNIGKSACDQCRYCTDLCPRYLLGYDVQPHLVMRSLSPSGLGEAYWSKWSSLCCACGLCTLYSCPEGLFPKEACDRSKEVLREMEAQWKGETEVEPHPAESGRHVPLKLLVQRLGLAEYDRPAPLKEIDFSPKQVRLPLSQHAGAPAEPVVRVGQRVREGQVVAEMPKDKLGARIHASIDGTVRKIAEGEILIAGS